MVADVQNCRHPTNRILGPFQEVIYEANSKTKDFGHKYPMKQTTFASPVEVDEELKRKNITRNFNGWFDHAITDSRSKLYMLHSIWTKKWQKLMAHFVKIIWILRRTWQIRGWTWRDGNERDGHKTKFWHFKANRAKFENI